jgi:hypothetical protein
MLFKQKKILLQQHVSTEHSILAKRAARSTRYAEIQTKSKVTIFYRCENLHKIEGLTSL